MERCRRWGSAAKPSFFTQTLHSPPFSSLLSVHHHHLHAGRQVTMNYKSAMMVNLVNLCIRLPISILSFAASASIFNAVGLLCFLHLISFHFFFVRLTNCRCATTGTRRKKIDRERRVCTCKVWSIISREEKERCTLADLLSLSPKFKCTCVACSRYSLPYRRTHRSHTEANKHHRSLWRIVINNQLLLSSHWALG